jgi:hypothetical protein
MQITAEKRPEHTTRTRPQAAVVLAQKALSPRMLIGQQQSKHVFRYGCEIGSPHV